MNDKSLAPDNSGCLAPMNRLRVRLTMIIPWALGFAAVLSASSCVPSAASAETTKPVIVAQAAATNSEQKQVPILERLRAGGNVIVHRYTGATRGNAPPALAGSIDDGQRMSSEGERLFQEIGATYRRLGIRVDRVYSSEYFFVHQHAAAAFGEPVTDSRDLTGSLYFRDAGELAASLAALRARTAAAPAPGKNTVLVTHQGKFDKAFGIWLPPGQTVVFHPDGTATPNLIANLSREQFVELK